jgi:hypothetical protein
VNGNGLDRVAFHIDVPNLNCEVITRENVSTVVGKSDIGDGGDDFGEE